MIIRLHIERLVIEGLPLNGAEGRVLRATLERELSRRLGDGTFNPKHLSGSHAVIRGGAIAIDGIAPAKLGDRIAASVHEGISAPRAGARK